METQRLALPFILAAQAQKHVTHNEALALLDTLVQLTFLDRNIASPPSSPPAGATYLVAASPSGAWAGHAGDVAAWSGGGWIFATPQAGWIAHFLDEDRTLVFDGTAWKSIVPTDVPMLGVGTAPDGLNRLAVKTSSLLMSHDDVSGSGNGSIFGTFNRLSATKDAAFNFQTNWVTNALMGLLGGSTFSLRVSPDGLSFKTVLESDVASGVGVMANNPKVIAATNYDNYAPADSWTTIAVNNASANDQNAFLAGSNAFRAPVDGIYAFTASIGWKQNGANVPATVSGRFTVNGTPVHPHPFTAKPIAGVADAILSAAVSLKLVANDLVRLQGRFGTTDGYFTADVTGFSGHLVA